MKVCKSAPSAQTSKKQSYMYLVEHVKARGNDQSHHQPLCSEQQTPPLLRQHGPVPVPTLPEGGRRAGRPAPIAAQVRHGRVGPGPVRRVSSAALVQGKNCFVLASDLFCGKYATLESSSVDRWARMRLLETIGMRRLEGKADGTSVGACDFVEHGMCLFLCRRDYLTRRAKSEPTARRYQSALLILLLGGIRAIYRLCS